MARDIETAESLRDHITTFIQHSTVLHMTTHTSESRLVSIARQGSQWLATVTTSSLLYGWLTEEPDPDVIIIDLRKTWTVGPFITLIDAFIEWIAPIWRASQLAGLAAKAAGTGEYLADTRYGRILIELLEPPEPPKQRTDSQTEPTERDTNTSRDE